jgi:hypothetical protein
MRRPLRHAVLQTKSESKLTAYDQIAKNTSSVINKTLIRFSGLKN